MGQLRPACYMPAKQLAARPEPQTCLKIHAIGTCGAAQAQSTTAKHAAGYQPQMQQTNATNACGGINATRATTSAGAQQTCLLAVPRSVHYCCHTLLGAACAACTGSHAQLYQQACTAAGRHAYAIAAAA